MAKEKTKKEMGLSVSETMKELRKKFGEEAVMILDQNTTMNIETIPSGSFGLDLALGVGGYPKGRVIEISGPESSGKTTLALHAVAEAQKTGGLCAYIDTEHALDPIYATKLGIDPKRLLISQPEHGEQALEIVESMVRTGEFAIIVIDSVASLVPKAEVEGEMGDPQVGRHAKLMSHGLRKLVPLIFNSKTVVIFINQIRMNIGGLPGAPIEFTTGGKALKFYSSIRLDIRRIAQIKKGEEVVGGRTRVKVVKNKVAPPFRQTEFDIIYGEGISKQGEVLALGEKYKIIQKVGNTYSYDGEKIAVGYDASKTFLKQNPEKLEKIVELIKEQFKVPEQTLVELSNEKDETV